MSDGVMNLASANARRIEGRTPSAANASGTGGWSVLSLKDARFLSLFAGILWMGTASCQLSAMNRHVSRLHVSRAPMHVKREPLSNLHLVQPPRLGIELALNSRPDGRPEVRRMIPQPMFDLGIQRLQHVDALAGRIEIRAHFGFDGPAVAQEGKNSAKLRRRDDPRLTRQVLLKIRHDLLRRHEAAFLVVVHERRPALLGDELPCS